MTSIELLKQDLDAELKLGTKMIVNWDMYIEMHKQEMKEMYLKGIENYDPTFKRKDDTLKDYHIVDTNEMVELPKLLDEMGEPDDDFQHSYKVGFEEGYNKAKETLYTEEQIIEIVKYTISEWASLNEQREHDHDKLVKTWLSIEFKNFIQSLKQPKKD